MKRLLLKISFLFCLIHSGQSQVYDIVLRNGRVIDPENGLDAIRNVGISSDRIMEISSNALQGKQILDVTGLVVAPGFIDLHVHGMTNEAHEYQAHDGVTTALELESGVLFIRDWIESKRNKTIVNYGATIPHAELRALAMESYQHYFDEAKKIIGEDGFGSKRLSILGINMAKANYQSLTDDDIKRLPQYFDQELASGALGIGVPVGYYPGAKPGEIFKVYQYAAEKKVPVFSHTRGFGMPGIQEAIANAAASGASLHIVHANSLSLADIQVTLDMVSDAQKHGLDITTEVYPYTAASTSLESAIFDDGWKEKLGMTYSDIQWEATGERLTEETFNTYRKQGGVVIMHMMKPEWIAKGIQSPVTSIGSDGMPYAPKAHPRTAGTFSRVLGKYVREEKLISLTEALRKMTILPARRLENIAPSMKLKGRIQVGADADITIFDPNTIIDKADFTGLRFSEGIKYVLVNGVFVVKEGTSVKGAFPGRPVLGKYRN